MAQSFIDAVNSGFPARRESVLTSTRPITPMARLAPKFPDKIRKSEDDDEAVAAYLAAEQEGSRDPDIVAMEDGGGMEGMDFRTMSGEGLATLSADEEELEDVSFADMVGEEAAVTLADRTGGEEPAYSITSGDEPVADGDMVEAMKPKFDKSALLDVTSGARPAGIPEETLGALFAKTHGGSFDPNSKTDRLKMNTIRDMITEDKSLLGLSPTKFAMKVYARK